MNNFADFGRRGRRRHVSEFGRRRRHRRVGEFGRRRRRHYSGFGAITGPVKGSQVLVGLLIGLAGVAGARIVSRSMTGLPDAVDKALPLIGASVAGLVSWFIFRKKNPERARSFLLGAAAAGGVTTVWPALQNQFPQLQDLVRLRMGMQVRRMGLPVTRTPKALNPNLAALTQVSLSQGRANLGAINALIQRRAMRQ